jgi:hypothetical protein
MGKILILFALLAAQMPSGDRSQITVKHTYVNNGVVIVTALEGKTSLELQCNNGVPSCNVLAVGDYTMVRLPKNRGLYDCANVEIYPKSGDPEAATKVGAFCLIDQK